MPLQELKIVVPSREAEELADTLLARGALSVGIEDAYAGTDREEDLFAEPKPVSSSEEISPSDKKDEDASLALWSNSLILALFPASFAVSPLVEEVLAEFHLESARVKLEDLPEQDWVKETQAQFDSIVVGDELAIVPSWREVDPKVAHSIRLDPGLAFGTGSHATTFLCLSWLRDTLLPGWSVLDYGCGSGILAIAAKKLGASHVVGVDIDPEALVVSRENAQRNDAKIDFYLASEYHKNTAFDVVVANILANPLRLLAAALAAYTKPGGRIVLAGILTRQQEELTEIYAPWFDLQVYDVQDGWVCLTGVKKSAEGEESKESKESKETEGHEERN